MTQYDVRQDSISNHANSMSTYSSRLSTGASAAETTLDSGAFGLVNTFLATGVTFLAGKVQDSITERSKDMTETMTNLRQIVKQYGSDDDNARTDVRKAGGK